MCYSWQIKQFYVRRWEGGGGKNLACSPQQKISFAINPKEWDAYLPASPKSFASSDLGREDLPTNVTFNSQCSQLLMQLPGLNLCHRSVMKMHPNRGSTCQTIPQAHGFGLARAGFTSWRPFRLNQCQV